MRIWRHKFEKWSPVDANYDGNLVASMCGLPKKTPDMSLVIDLEMTNELWN